MCEYRTPPSVEQWIVLQRPHHRLNRVQCRPYNWLLYYYYIIIILYLL